VKNKWAEKVEQIRLATKLNIELLSCMEQEWEQTRRNLEEDGGVILRSGFFDGLIWYIAIRKNEWPEPALALLPLMLDSLSQEESPYSEWQEAADWVKGLFAGYQPPLPAILKTHWNWAEARVCFVIEKRNAVDPSDLAVWQDLFQTYFKQKLSTYLLSQQTVLLLVPLSTLADGDSSVDSDPDTWLEWAASLHDLLSTEALETVRIVVSKPMEHPEQLSRVIPQCKQTLAALHTFFPKTMVAGDWQYAVEKLMASLDASVIQSLRLALDSLRELPDITWEQKETFEVFCQNNLNISETARSLYLHRNTLLYRLDRLKEATGLDPRQFADALLLRVALLLDKLSK